MALSDWIQNFSADAAITVSIDVTNPVVGSGSLNIITANTTVQGFNAYLDAPFSKGFTKGRIRTLVAFRDITYPASQPRRHTGIVCMQDQLDVSKTTGNCYYLGLGAGNTSGTRLSVFKIATGLDQTASTTELFEQALSPAPSVIGDFYPIELEWVADLSGLGGTRLIARVGTKNSEDFGTLADVYDAVDASSPLLTSVAEGVFARQGHATGIGHEWNLDQTTIFELV